jgi:hypothetical protein
VERGPAGRCGGLIADSERRRARAGIAPGPFAFCAQALLQAERGIETQPKYVLLAIRADEVPSLLGDGNGFDITPSGIIPTRGQFG